MNPLPCPFCGAVAVAHMEGPEPRPFYLRCSDAACPGHNTSVSYADAEVALARWNHRVQPPPESAEIVAHVYGFAKKNLIRGEVVTLALDRTGVLVSDKLAFSPHSTPLMKKPRD